MPPHDAPKEEAYRASCKLYVAMTRARHELILSFHGKASPWIAAVSGTIGAASWSDVERFDDTLLLGTPDLLPEIEPDQDVQDSGRLTGLQFIYSTSGFGLSLEAQDKLIELVDGRGLLAAGGRRLKWRDVPSLAVDLLETRRYDLLFGPIVAAELRKALPLPVAIS